MKRRLSVALCFLVVVLLAIRFGPALERSGPVSRVRFESLEVGINFREVVKLLGAPPGDYRSGEVDLDLTENMPRFNNVLFDPDFLTPRRRLRHEWWSGDEGIIWVCFDEQDKVVDMEFTQGRSLPSGFVARVRRMVGFR